jgi:hypothetical protein
MSQTNGRIFYNNRANEGSTQNFYTFNIGGNSGNTETTPDYLDINMQKQNMGQKWRSTAQRRMGIWCELKKEERIGGVGLFGHNLTEDATIIISGWDNTFQTELRFEKEVKADQSLSGYAIEPGYNEMGYGGYSLGEWQPPYTFVMLEPDEVAMCGHIEVLIYDDANPDGYLEISRFWASDYLEPRYNQGRIDVTWMDRGFVEEAEDGTPHYHYGPLKRQVTASWNHIQDSESALMLDIQRIAHKKNDVVFVGFPNAGTAIREIYVVLGTLAAWDPLEYFLRGHSTGIVVTESIGYQSDE